MDGEVLRWELASKIVDIGFLYKNFGAGFDFKWSKLRLKSETLSDKEEPDAGNL